jgi:hypothetical protein
MGAAALRDRATEAAAQALVDARAARARGDTDRARMLEAMLAVPAALVLYGPERDHYGFAFGDLVAARHIAVVVPGVGRDLNLVHDWLPWAQNLFEVTERSAVVLWKGYDDPVDLAVAVADIAVEDRRAQEGAQRLSAFVALLQQGEAAGDQSVTVVAHSFGSVVTGEALANYAMTCTDVVVLGSPGIGVESFEELHLRAGHFFAEKAPRDVVAGLGVIGADPASLSFGGTRMTTNEVGRPDVVEHSSYFTRGSRALENIGDVVMGRYGDVAVQSTNVANAVGDLVTTLVKAPLFPLRAVADHYTGPGFRLARVADRTVHVVATEAGAVVRDALQAVADAAGRALGLGPE